jgi:hypothetical protein
VKENHRTHQSDQDSSDDGSCEMDTVLHFPSYIENNYVMNPIIELYMTLEGETMTLDKTEEEIVDKIEVRIILVTLIDYF